MKITSIGRLAAALALVGLVLTACGGSTSTPAAPSDDALAATVDAAVQATATAEARVQATIDAAIQATRQAEATPVPGVPTPAPTADAATLSEEELAALIDEAVAEAVTASETASTSTEAATSDGELTQEEIDLLYAYLDYAEWAVDQTLAYIDAYYGLYADLAEETLALLIAIEQDLSTLADSLAAVDAALQQGLALAEDALDQLEAAAAAVDANLEGLQAQAHSWLANFQAELAGRAEAVLAYQPTEVASDRRGAIQSARAYLDAVKGSLADNMLSQSELASIAQAGANATASLKSGGAELQNLADSIGALTAQLARGQLPQAKLSLGSLEFSIPSLPSLP